MKYATYEENLKFVLEHNIGNLSVEEKETIINMRRDDPLGYVDTSDPSILLKIKKMLTKDPEHWRLVDYTVSGVDPNVLTSVVASCPKRLISFRAKREYTKEEKSALSARFAKSDEG